MPDFPIPERSSEKQLLEPEITVETAFMPSQPEIKPSSCIRRNSYFIIVVLSILVIVLSVLLAYFAVIAPLAEHTSGRDGEQGKQRSAHEMTYVRLTGEVKPTYYDLDFFIEPGIVRDEVLYPYGEPVAAFNGTALISLHAHEHARRIQLNADRNLLIQSFRLRSEDVAIERMERSDLSDVVTFHLDNELTPGTDYELHLSFVGAPDPLDKEGLYAGQYEDGNQTKLYVVTQMEPAAARKMFPCWDEPEFKARFKIIITHPEEYHSLSNMPVQSATNLGNGWVKRSFEESVLMPTYLVAVCMTDFHNLSRTIQNSQNETIEFKVWAKHDSIHLGYYALEAGVRLFHFFEDFYKIPYALPKIDMISIPNFMAGGMENWGLITYRRRYLILDQDIMELKVSISKVVTHEIAHQWFGNLVTPVWWNDIWLNEGFASYMEYVGMNHLHPDWDVWSLFFVDTTMEVLTMDALLTSHPIISPKHIRSAVELKTFFDLVSYRKGSATLHMLRSLLGTDVFQDGILLFLQKFKFSNAVSMDLWESFEQAKSAAAQSRDEVAVIPHTITSVMEKWTNQLGYPVVDVIVDYSSNQIRLSQKPFNTNIKRSQSQQSDRYWFLYIEIEAPLSGQKIITWLEDQPFTVKFKQPVQEIVLVNSKLEHFYRVNYDIQTWRNIVDLLRANSSALPEITKTGLVDNAWSLAAAGQLEPDIALELTEVAVKDDHSYGLWRAVLYHVRYAYIVLYRTEYHAQFKRYCHNLVQVASSTEAEAGDFENYRQQFLHNFAREVETDQNVHSAIEATMQWVRDVHNESAQMPQQEQLCTAVKHSELWLTNLLRNLSQNQHDPRRYALLQGLGCSDDAATITHFFNDLFDESQRIPQDQMSYIIVIAIGDGLNTAYGVLWSYFLVPENFVKFANLFTDFHFALKNILNSLYGSRYRQYELDAMVQLNNTHYEVLGVAQDEFIRLIEIAENNMQWVQNVAPKLGHWLDENYPFQVDHLIPEY